jgi:hypothetical protein
VMNHTVRNLSIFSKQSATPSFIQDRGVEERPRCQQNICCLIRETNFPTTLSNIAIDLVDRSANDVDNEIIAVHLNIPNGSIVLDQYPAALAQG